MPWEKTCPMDERMTFIADALKKHWSVAHLCRAYRMSRKTGYKWIARYEPEGWPGMHEHHRAPHDRLAEARALTSPLPDSPEIVEKGKGLYEGKGACANCHGLTGRGDGPAVAELDPSPRNFHHRGFRRHRTEGEIFWATKHGVPGTSMIGFGALLTDEEIWAVIRYLRNFAGDRGMGREHRGMGRRDHMGGVRWHE